MILEHAPLHVVPGQEGAFESAFQAASKIVSGMPGFRSLRLSRCVEEPKTYLLLVEWNALEDHTVGFRQSAQYEDWRALLHHFYEPFPTVLHFEDVLAC